MATRYTGHVMTEAPRGPAEVKKKVKAHALTFFFRKQPASLTCLGGRRSVINSSFLELFIASRGREYLVLATSEAGENT